LQPRFQRTIDAQSHSGQAGAPHHAVRNYRAEQVCIVGDRHGKIRIARVRRDLLKRALERCAVAALEGCRRTGLICAQHSEDVAVQRCDLGKWRGGEALKRGKCRAHPLDERGGGMKLRVTQTGAWIGRMQIR
jgi:hypothetical protein